MPATVFYAYTKEFPAIEAYLGSNHRGLITAPNETEAINLIQAFGGEYVGKRTFYMMHENPNDLNSMGMCLVRVPSKVFYKFDTAEAFLETIKDQLPSDVVMETVLQSLNNGYYIDSLDLILRSHEWVYQDQNGGVIPFLDIKFEQQ